MLSFIFLGNSCVVHATILCSHVFGCMFDIYSSNVWVLLFLVNGECYVNSSEWGALENTQALLKIFYSLS